MAIAVVVALLTIGSVLFHFLSPWYLTEIASNWGAIDNTITITFIVTGSAFVAVNLFMVYSIVRYRKREGSRADYEPESPRLEAWLVGLTTIGVVAMLAPGLFAWNRVINVPEDAAAFEVVGQQWHWTYRFGGADGELGKVDAKFISETNPYGLDPDDPKGADDVLVRNPEVHLPVGQPVKVLLRSLDVLHNFAVPQFRVKMDLVPGMVTYIWFKPTRTGSFDLLCEELCGIAHFTMRGKVVVDEEPQFQAWLDRQRTFAQTQEAVRVAGNVGAGQASYGVCATCHGLEGEGQAALNAPKLAGQESWYLKRQLQSFLTGARGTHEKDVYGQQMRPMAATLVDDRGIDNVVAFIRTLPDAPAAPTLDRKSVRGAALYKANCAACHGGAGQGNWAMNAPQLARMSDFYLVTQLRNFQQGIRGSHRADLYGPQMVSMSRSLGDDEERIKDLVAFIATLDGEAKQQAPEKHAIRRHPVAPRGARAQGAPGQQRTH